MNIGDLASPPGSRKAAKRVGRGIGSGHGKTSTRGHKGQKARGSIRPGFEGGQTPLNRRMRKRRGISQTAYPQGIFRKEYAIINVGQLERFDAGEVLTPARLLELGMFETLKDGVRILGGGELTKSLTVEAHHFTKSAQQKLEAAGGTVRLIAPTPPLVKVKGKQH